MIKPRSVTLTGIANFFVPTLGHVYLGMPKRGFTIFVSGILLMAVFGWTGIATSLWGFYFTQGFYFLIIIFLIVDGAIQTRRRKNYELKKYNRWYFYIGIFIAIIFILNTLMSFRPYIYGFDNHRNVSRNMEPILKPKELIVTDTRGYLFGFNLKRGDIITFRYPKDPSITYVKRVIGLPGERVEIIGGITYIDDAPISEPYVLNKNKPYSIDMKKITVPSESLFVLGDNRDNSNDSRFWGFVPQSEVQGVVTAIWYSPEKGRIGPIVE